MILLTPLLRVQMEQYRKGLRKVAVLFWERAFLGKGIPGGGVGLQLMRGLPPRTIDVMVIPQV